MEDEKLVWLRTRQQKILNDLIYVDSRVILGVLVLLKTPIAMLFTYFWPNKLTLLHPPLLTKRILKSLSLNFRFAYQESC